MRHLRAKLYAHEHGLLGRMDAEVRSYDLVQGVVRDGRTGIEADAGAVLDGDLDLFLREP